MAIAARMPMMTTTTRSSMSVKPERRCRGKDRESMGSLAEERGERDERRERGGVSGRIESRAPGGRAGWAPALRATVVPHDRETSISLKNNDLDEQLARHAHKAVLLFALSRCSLRWPTRK